jgi:hypothetical protein
MWPLCKVFNNSARFVDSQDFVWAFGMDFMGKRARVDLLYWIAVLIGG